MILGTALRNRKGFTLVEMIVSMGVSVGLIGVLVLGSIAFQQSFAAADFHAAAQNDELRVCDYLARDLQSATAATISQSGSKIQVTLPPANANLIATNLNIPVVGQILPPTTGNRTITYVYSNQQVTRNDGTTSLCLAQSVSQFNVAASGNTYTITASFAPNFIRSQIAVPEFVLTRTVTMRNAGG